MIFEFKITPEDCNGGYFLLETKITLNDKVITREKFIDRSWIDLFLTDLSYELNKAVSYELNKAIKENESTDNR